MKHKLQLPDTIIAVECGYRYKFFGRDAEVAGDILGFYVNPGQDKDTYCTCSFPVNRLSVHTARLANKGYRVAHLGQAETNAERQDVGKAGVFEREIIGLFSKSTLPIITSTEMEMGATQDDNANNMIVVFERAIPKQERIGNAQVRITVVVVSLATGGQLRWDSFEDGSLRRELMSRLLHFEPVEIVASDDLTAPTLRTLESLGLNHGITPTAPQSVPGDVRFESRGAKTFLNQRAFVEEFFASHQTLLTEVSSLPEDVLGCLSALIHHLAVYSLEDFLCTRGGGSDGTFKKFSEIGYMHLPSETLTSLEIFDVAGLQKKGAGARVHGSLNWVVNNCRTAFGARKMRLWLAKPLLDVDEIRRRQAAVHDMARGEYVGELDRLKGKVIAQTPDLERVFAKMSYGKASPKEMLAFLKCVNRIITDIAQSEAHSVLNTLSPLLQSLLGDTEHDELNTLCDTALSQINESAAEKNCTAELFMDTEESPTELRALEEEQAEAHSVLKEHLIECRKAVRCPSLAYKTIGSDRFLLDVPNTSARLIPKGEGWVKESSVAKSTRYHTPVIKECLQKLQLAGDTMKKLAERHFVAHQKRFVKQHARVLQNFIDALGDFDCLASLATLARDTDWCQPDFFPDVPGVPSSLEVKNGRHPVIDRILKESDKIFVANDVHIRGQDNEQVVIVTGPNMGGKSSYLRQAALLVLLAQVGSFVPAESAKMSVFDAIYVRLGSHDSLLDGQSSFLVEITEMSTILQKATPRSLLVLDEIGRGTSTFDGIAIAHSILEWLICSVGCTTLFVTHYPEILELSPVFKNRLRTCHMSFLEDPKGNAEGGEGEAMEVDVDGGDTGTKVTFLFKLVEGNSPSSFGMNVAKLAGIGDDILKVAVERSKMLVEMTKEAQAEGEKVC